MKQRITLSDTMATASFNKEIYDHTAVLAAAYNFTGKYGIEVEVEDNDTHRNAHSQGRLCTAVWS